MPRKVPLDGRVAVLESRADAHERAIADLNADINELRGAVDRTDGHVTDARLEMRDGLADMKKTLTEVTMSALNAVPQWMALKENRKATAMNALLAILLAVIGWLVASH